MRRLENKKLLTIICGRELETAVLNAAKRRGVGGYTVVQASGMGASGIQSGMLDADSNILVYIILSEARLIRLLDDLDAMLQSGYRLKAMASDIALLPRKPFKRAAPAGGA
jgi:PII-like signaling protein